VPVTLPPDPQREILQKTERAAKWHSRLSSLQLWLLIAPAALFLVVCCGCAGWQYLR
jgi:hypothetical protein